MEKFLVMGCGSRSDLKYMVRPTDDYPCEDINPMIDSMGILRLDEPIITSVHRSKNEKGKKLQYLEYAEQIIDLALEKQANGDRVVAMWFGGRAFALPGVMAALMSSIPTIGVPFSSASIQGGSLDAFYSVANVPFGTPLGTSGQTNNNFVSLMHAVESAEKILNYDGSPLFLDYSREDPGMRKALSLIEELELPTTTDKESPFWMNLCRTEEWEAMRKGEYKGNIHGNPGKLFLFTTYGGQESVFTNSDRTHDLVDVMETYKSLYMGEPTNAVLFAAQVMGQHDPVILDRLVEYIDNHKEEKNELTQVINDAAFVRGR